MRLDPRWLSLYYHTATNMQPRQVAGVGFRKAREAVLPRLPVDFDARYERQVPDSLSPSLGPVADNLAVLRESLDDETRHRHRDLARSAAEGEVTFLSETVSFPDGFDWDDDRLTDRQELWWEYLFAFDPLWKLVTGLDSPADAQSTVETFDEWLDGWIRTVRVDEPGYLRGRWTPYCVSLRLRYWLQYLAWREAGGDDAPLDGRLAREAYKNALFLANHVEWEVGGNHLIENGGPLVLAGVAFDESGWRRQGLSVLERTATTQFLADGGHFERSPMYHVATLVQYLTACDVLDRAGHDVPDAVRRAARAATGFLSYLRPPDDRLPLLNDSAYGYTLSLPACLRYAERVDLGEGPTGGWGEESTGYRWLRNDAGAMLVDGGPVGPPHLPAHSHNDLLSVLLWVDGRPVFTDTGVHSYEDETRQYARSVAAHNTVQVGDGEPIPIGGKYLMGRRTRPETRTASSAAVDLFEGRYDGHPASGPAYDHHREVRVGEDWWTLWDRVDADRPARVRSRLHLHPDVTVDEGDPLELDVPDAPTLFAYPLGEATISVGESPYFPRFGERRERGVLTTEAGEVSRARFGVLLTPRPVSEVRTRTADEGRLAELRFDGVAYRNPESRL